MIIVRSPLRISLGGGGTDLPSYYKKHGGILLSAAIDKYVYITLHRNFNEDIQLKYSKFECVKDVEEIKNGIFRECLKDLGCTEGYIEISSLADIPAGTGLGSSGSFTTALIKALYTYKKQSVSPGFLAEQAYKIEKEKLGQPVGKQDQYIAAFGGITTFEFMPDDKVEIAPLRISNETLYSLEDNLMLFFTGYSRSASTILQEQDDKSQENDERMIESLHFIKELGVQSKMALELGNLTKFGELMNVHWEHKKRRSSGMSNDDIDKWYKLGIENGAVGGKLIGAGGGGFIMFYAKDKMKLRHCMNSEGLQELRFRFDFDGTRVVIQ